MVLHKDWLAFIKANKLLVMFTIKAIGSLVVAQTTEFVPDEYWQSTEVAYRSYFGRGHYTWEWKKGLRSAVVPGFIQCLYWLGDQLNLISPLFMTLVPQIVVTLMTMLAMVAFHEYARKKFNVRVARYTMYLLGINWFTTFCGARLITNQVEMNLICFCLYLLETPEGFLTNILLPVLLVLSFVIRPTVGIFWAPYVRQLLRKLLFVRDSGIRCLTIIFSIITLFHLIYLDCEWYAKPVITFWEFFNFNFLERGNAEFGSHSAFWYFYSGLPSIFGPVLLLTPIFLTLSGDPFGFAGKILFYIGLYSCLDHKEIRFMLPIVPNVCLLLGAVFAGVESRLKAIEICGVIFSRASIKKGMIYCMLVLNIGATCLIGLHHQNGIKPASNFVYQKMKDIPLPRTWLMMPCYSLPTNTYLHNLRADFKFYVCSPSRFLELNDGEDNFLQKNGFETVDVVKDIEDKLKHSFPPHFVMTYEKVATTVQYAFRKNGYYFSECARFQHTHAGDFHRFVVVLCASPLNLHGGRMGGYLKGS